ncbi:Tetratricopeptide repeat 11 Fission 1 protein [Corchorus capsularis]|uniref:Tetratricopeptide repeat 11 Fission 1 protein n=1 Tax=Corchorus capsularis TaxID=210143 RepID=A0A1R3G105_COCAP|nr:Tetratricopeptide repeat 11 Fission 1 protein [Corchorus capsularis]
MEAKIGKFFEPVTNLFSVSDQLPWCDSDIIVGCEREVAEAEKGSGELKNECIMRLSWALFHSRRAEDIQRGIAMLEEPDWRQAKSLKQAIEDRITKDGVIGIGIAVTVAGLIAGGITAALARKN